MIISDWTLIMPMKTDLNIQSPTPNAQYPRSGSVQWEFCLGQWLVVIRYWIFLASEQSRILLRAGLAEVLQKWKDEIRWMMRSSSNYFVSITIKLNDQCSMLYIHD
jgi:hypothetical protein